MLFTVELFDTVTSFVVLTEDGLLLSLVKEGLVVPRRSGSGVGSTVANFALQNVDCTRNEGSMSETTGTKDVHKSQA